MIKVIKEFEVADHNGKSGPPVAPKLREDAKGHNTDVFFKVDLPWYTFKQ